MAGRIAVYYRASGEHLNPDNPSSESGSSFNGLLNKDFGHAFLRIDDEVSGDSQYLDGWMLDDGSFYWNPDERQDRLDDHHNVVWETDDSVAQQGVQEIFGIKNSSTPYDVWHNNCADMTAHVLDDLGYSVNPETTYIPGHGNVALPGDMGAAVEQALNSMNIAYDTDVNLPMQ